MTFTVKDPNGGNTFVKSNIDVGSFAFTTDKAGLYEFCFQDVAGTRSLYMAIERLSVMLTCGVMQRNYQTRIARQSL